MLFTNWLVNEKAVASDERDDHLVVWHQRRLST